MLKNNNDINISPLIAAQRVHRDRYGTMKVLGTIFNNFEKIFSHLSREDQFLYRSYIMRLIIQNTCQYVEDVGSYSVACKETGLLYVERVISVTSSEIESFYNQVQKLTNADIQQIFNLHDVRDLSSMDYTAMKTKYKKIKDFRKKYQGLYNAMKHGNRVFLHEISTRDVPMTSLHGTNLGITWINVNLRKKIREIVKTRDGSDIEIVLKERKRKNLILHSDDITEFVEIIEDCYQIIEQILINNSPDLNNT